tara:strand:+ start:18027 stop:18299 length:273 start_codon:yes stop_codon:yes gene_type:complete
VRTKTVFSICRSVKVIKVRESIALFFHIWSFNLEDVSDKKTVVSIVDGNDGSRFEIFGFISEFKIVKFLLNSNGDDNIVFLKISEGIVVK